MSETFHPLPIKMDENPEQALNDNFLTLFRILNDIRDWITTAKMDWGTGTDQISAVDVPIADAGSLVTATEIEGALQEIFGDYQAGGVSRTLGGDLDLDDHLINNILGLDFKTATELTINAGVVTVTQSIHTVDTANDDATDDLDTINGGATTQFIILRAENDARTIVIKHGTGNVWLKGKADLSLDDLEDGLALFWTGTKWIDIGAGGGGVDTSGIPVDNDFAKFTDADTIEGRSYSEAVSDLSLDTRRLDNLCRNAAFASRSGGVTSEPDEWTLEGTPTVAYDTVDVGYGNYAVKLTASGAGDEGISQTLTHLKVSTKYQVFARIKVDVGDTASLITTGATTNINEDSTSASWEDITGEFITDASGTDVVIKLVASADTDVAYFCGITCVEGSIPPGNFIRGFDGDLDAISSLQWGYLGGSSGTDHYVDRGDPNDHDFTLVNFTTDWTWRDLDLSAIVPAGATAVDLRIVVIDDAIGSRFQLRKNGNVNVHNVLSTRTLVIDLAIDIVAIVSCDVGRKIEYRASNLTFSAINITVKGWWIP